MNVTPYFTFSLGHLWNISYWSFPNLIFSVQISPSKSTHTHPPTGPLARSENRCLFTISITQVFSLTSRKYFQIAHASQSLIQRTVTYIRHCAPVSFGSFPLLWTLTSFQSIIRTAARVIFWIFKDLPCWKLFYSSVSYTGYDPNLKHGQRSLT